MLLLSPCGLCLNQSFSADIIHFVSNRFKDPLLYEENKAFPLTYCSQTWHGRLHALEVEILLSVDCGRAEASLKKLVIQRLEIVCVSSLQCCFDKARKLGTIMVQSCIHTSVVEKIRL